MIYTNEKVEYLRTIQSPYDGRKRSYVSSNPFESLGVTNPELFNLYKLNKLRESKGLIKAFNKYFNDILDADYERYKRFIDGKGEEWTDEDGDEYQREFNVSVYTMLYGDIQNLIKSTGLSEATVYSMVYNAYIPEAFTEQGCKKLIDIRIKSTKILIEYLSRMMVNNYEILELTAAEAADISRQLKNKQTNDKGISRVKDIISNPKILEKFRIKGTNNYDFRSVGGACVFIASGSDLEAANPTKLIPYLFKYDAIVFSHGEYSANERPYGPLSFITNDIHAIIYNTGISIDKVLEMYGKNEDMISDRLAAKMANTKSYIMGLYLKKSFNKTDMHGLKDAIYSIINDSINESNNIKDKKLREEFRAIINKIDYMYQPIVGRDNVIQSFVDGKSTNWVMQPVISLKGNTFTHITDLLRALKSEGFKNVLIYTCNPGSVKLPIDIRLDKDFKVTMGLYSVLKEHIEDLVITEGIGSNIMSFIRGIFNTITEIGRNIADGYRNICKKISDVIKNKFPDKHTKFDNPVEMQSIEIINRGSRSKSTICRNPAEMENAVIESNESIRKLMENRIREDKEYIKKIEKAMGNKGFFEGVRFI